METAAKYCWLIVGPIFANDGSNNAIWQAVYDQKAKSVPKSNSPQISPTKNWDLFCISGTAGPIDLKFGA